jgi:hypothetical protein
MQRHPTPACKAAHARKAGWTLDSALLVVKLLWKMCSTLAQTHAVTPYPRCQLAVLYKNGLGKAVYHAAEVAATFETRQQQGRRSAAAVHQQLVCQCQSPMPARETCEGLVQGRHVQAKCQVSFVLERWLCVDDAASHLLTNSLSPKALRRRLLCKYCCHCQWCAL